MADNCLCFKCLCTIMSLDVSAVEKEIKPDLLSDRSELFQQLSPLFTSRGLTLPSFSAENLVVFKGLKQLPNEALKCRISNLLRHCHDCCSHLNIAETALRRNSQNACATLRVRGRKKRFRNT